MGGDVGGEEGRMERVRVGGDGGGKEGGGRGWEGMEEGRREGWRG